MSVNKKEKDISVEDVHAALAAGEKLVLVDVRTAEEHKTRHIQGDKLVSLNNKSIEELSSELRELTADIETVVLYCQSGARSGMARGMLESLGFDNLKSMTGGISAWKSKGYEVEGE